MLLKNMMLRFLDLPGVYFFLIISKCMLKSIKSLRNEVLFPLLKTYWKLWKTGNLVLFSVPCLRQFYSLQYWIKKCNWSVNQPFDAVKLPETKTDLAQMIDTYSGWQLIHLIGSYSFWNELDRVKSSQSQMQTMTEASMFSSLRWGL